MSAPDLHASASLAFALRNLAGECHNATTRGGELLPCEKPAVALRYDDGEGEGRPYPVCAYHARARMVPLVDILAAVTDA